MKLRSVIMQGVLAAAVALSAGCASLCREKQGQYPEMKQVLQKLESGKRLTVAYFGGSITWGATATDPMRTSWRALLTQMLEKTYPDAHITAVDAAIGGKGSDLGVFRVDRDVIPYHPDLAFVEFAVNDGANPERVECMEGILRKLHRSNPEMAIAVVITGSGKTEFKSPREEEYRKLAEYYGLPVFSIVPEVQAKIAAGEFKPMDILTDGTHPNDRGYKLYADIIFRELEAAFHADGPAVPFPAKSMTANRFESARMIELASLRAPGWKTEVPSVTGVWFDHQPSRWLDSVIVPETKNAELSLDLDCTGIGAYFEMLPGGSKFELLADGEPAVRVNTVFKQQYPGMGNAFKLLPPPEKRRRITVKAEGEKLRLGYLLVTGTETGLPPRKIR